jgi:Tol biopolymer transport system component
VNQTAYHAGAAKGETMGRRHRRMLVTAAGLVIGWSMALAVMPALGASPSLTTTVRPSPVALVPGEPWLAFAWYPDSLYLVRPDGTDRHRIDLGIDGVPSVPSWSPDGERIAFVVRDTAHPNGAIWTAAADGSDAAFTYDGDGGCPDGAFYPVWSPDGQRLALVCYRPDGQHDVSQISVLDLATKVRSDLVGVTWPEFIDNPPSWSPDGSAIAFDILTWDPTDTFVIGQFVATVATQGGEAQRLTDPAMFGSHPDWSPDGAAIVFNTHDTGNTHGIEQASNLYTVAPDGTGLRQLSTASVDGHMRLGMPFWSTDGSRIWVSIGRDWEKDSTGQYKNTLGWVDAATGEFYEIGTEGKRFRERPTLVSQ